MITKNPGCLVEIFLIQNKILMFDFGNFGIAVRRNRLIPCLGNKYAVIFMKNWYECLSYQMKPKLEKIPLEVLDEIKAILKYMPWDVYASDILDDLLWKVFRKYFRRYRGYG